MTGEDGSPTDAAARADFVRRAVDAGAEWARFTDPKLLGVLVFLGLGVTDLVQHAHRLWEAHHGHAVGGWIATLGFLVAVALAVLTVSCATFGLFPRVTPAGGARSLLFFGGIAAFGSAAEYHEALRAASGPDLERQLADQAWEIARIARHKLAWARRAYLAVVAFLAAWAAARIGLAFA